MKSKTLICLLLWLCVGILVYAETALAVPYVSLEVLDPYIEVGESFDIQIWADADNTGYELTGFGFDLNTSTTYISYNSYTIGPEFTDVSSPNYFSGLMIGTPANNMLLATLSFTAGTTPGTFSAISLSGTYDGLFYGLFYTDGVNDYGYDISASTSITIYDNSPTSVPEPSAVLLLGAGLLGLIGLRKRARE